MRYDEPEIFICRCCWTAFDTPGGFTDHKCRLDRMKESAPLAAKIRAFDLENKEAGR